MGMLPGTTLPRSAQSGVLSLIKVLVVTNDNNKYYGVPRFLVRNELNDPGGIAMRKEWFPVLERGT